MPYKLTPYDRRVQAQLLREQRLGSSYKAIKKKEQEAAQAASLAKEQEKEDGNWFTGLLETVGDLGANLVTGLGKGLEGIYDLGAGAVGAVGGLFSDDFEKSVQKHIAKDHVGEWFGNDWQAALDESWLNDSTVGGIIEGVAQGVGQLLPAVGVSIATGGAALPALLTTMGSAAGTGAEQAFQEGASYGEGMLYGVISGGIEGATEALMPGLGGLYGNGAKVFSKLGKGARAAAKVGKEVAEEVVETGVKEVAQAGLKEAAKAGLKEAAGQIGKETADVGLKRVAKSALGEGFEEMLSEVAAPATKTIYKGKDALAEYGEGDFWAGVLEAGVIGAGTDIAYGKTIGKALKTTGVYGDARSVAEHIDEQKKQRGKAGLSQADQVQIEQNIKADQELLSGRLQKLSEKKRAKVFEKMPTFKAMFEADGTIKAEQAAALDANIKAAGDTTYSAEIRSSTASAEKISKALKNFSTEDQEVRAFTGELTEEQRQCSSAVRRAMSAVSERSGGAIGDYVIVEKIPDGDASFDKSTGMMAISVDALQNGTANEAINRELEKAGWRDAVVHETFHAIEDTNAGKELAKLVTDNKALHDLAITDVLERGYLQDFFGKDGKKADAKTVADGIKKLIAKENNGEVLTESEQEALDEYRAEVAAFANQRLLGNKAFMKKLITTEPSTAEKLIAKIRELRENLKVRKDPAAKAQLEFVRKAEKLFMQGLSEVGGTIDAIGKIHLANREEDEEKGKVRRLMAGEHAKTADKPKLATAQKMIADGADSETVRRETGWYQGYDGKWRFEIDDSDIEIAFNGRLSRDPDIRRYAELVEKVYFLATATAAEQSELADLDKKIGKNSITPDKLGDMVKHPALFEAYPQLADLDVYFAEGTNDASYHPGFKEIALPKRLKMDPKKFKKTLIHEIQHAVQDIEGFASGSNVAMFNNTTERSAYDQYQSTAGEIEARDAANRADLNAEERKNTRPDIDRSDVVFADVGEVNYSFDVTQEDIDRYVDNAYAKQNDQDYKKYAVADEKLIRDVAGEIDITGYAHALRDNDIRHIRNSHGENTNEKYPVTSEDIKNIPRIVAGYDKVIVFSKPGGKNGLMYVKVTPDGLVYYLEQITTQYGNEKLLINKQMIKTGIDDIPDIKGLRDAITKKESEAEFLADLKARQVYAQSVYQLHPNNSISQNSEKSTPSAQEISGKVSRSRKVTGEMVTISKGELAKLHANYAGDKVFARKSVTEAVATIDALQKVPGKLRQELVNDLWKGYNERLHSQGFDLFTELMWHKIHAMVMQETGFEMSEDEIATMDEQIVNALHQIVASGQPSIKARLESDTSTEGYRKQIAYWREEHTRVAERAKALPKLAHELQRLADLKKGRYVNAANYQGDTFNVAVNELARMNWRGALVSDTKIREHFAKLAKWYTKENPLYKGDGEGNTAFKQEIADALNALGNSQNGALTVEDLQTAEAVVKYFIHEIETHDTVWKDGKREDAVPFAKEYIEKIRRAKEVSVKCGIWGSLMRSKFARMVADPAMLMRQADGYLNGFFTEQYEALRQGTIDANVKELELSEEFEQFWGKHKAYGKRYNSATVTFDGKEMPLQEAISLYMTMKRAHAFAGLAGAGFDIEGKHATEEISAGFAEELQKQIQADMQALPPEEFLTLTKKRTAEIEQAALEKVVAAKRDALYDQFTAEDRALIEVMERAYEACREIKVKIDEILQGYSNVTGGYYYPIKRTGLAENVDAYTGFEGDRVSNLSMNKDTVKNAHKLLIEPAHVVLMRHLKATSLYHGLGVFTDNFNRLYNLNIGTNANNPITVRTALGESGNYAKEMIKYFKELKQDVEGISKKRSQEKWYNDAVGFIRSHYATYQLGANPKVWVTQLSSLIAATNILDADSLAKGLKVSGKDVDEYCRLAWLRNHESSAAMAQAVSEPKGAMRRVGGGILQKIRDVAMLPIGKVDRLVVTRLFGACQVQIEKNGGAKVGTKENKIEAGKLMTRVILETQQNSLATERSAAMRSGDELLKGFTMFSADAMKVGARFVDAFGELSVLKTLRKEAKKAGNGAEAERLQKEIKRARKQCVRAAVSLVGVALFNAALAYAFKWLYRRDEEENVGTFVADTFGNMLGGVPFVRDLYGFFQDGFEMDHFLISTVNDVLGTAAASFELVGDAMDGKEITKQDVMGTMRKISYAAGQLSGLPVRNVYNFGTGMLNRVSPEAGYEVSALFTSKAYASDLQKAIEAGDDEMVGTIAGLMIDEKIGIEDNAMRKALQELTAKGHSVLPRSVGDSVTVNGETVTLTAAQQKKLRKVYGIGQEAVADMVKLKQFGEADEKVQAAAIKFVYDVYWDLALEDALGLDLAEKNVLFAEAIDIEKLAIIIATARAIEADKDKSGKAISGTKKRKIQTFVNSLRLSAAEKYMVMGYLGYSNANGEGAVKAHISKLNLSKSEKEKLLKYSGYGA